jgi:hypothetical protein
VLGQVVALVGQAKAEVITGMMCRFEMRCYRQVCARPRRSQLNVGVDVCPRVDLDEDTSDGVSIANVPNLKSAGTPMS